MERFVERFRAKATKARQAQSRVRSARQDRARSTRDPKDNARAGASSSQARALRAASSSSSRTAAWRSREPRPAHDAELWLERGEHVSLVGPNGTGKTTLIDALAGQRPLDGGKLRTGHNVKVGYLSQHAEELEAGGARTVARGRGQAHRPDAQQGPRRCSAASCSAARRPRSRSTASAAASAAACRWPSSSPARERPDPRRADQPPRPRVPRGARGRPPALPGLAAARLPRPRAARRRRHPHGRRRPTTRCAPSRRLAGVLRRARGAQGLEGEATTPPPTPLAAGTAEHPGAQSRAGGGGEFAGCSAGRPGPVQERRARRRSWSGPSRRPRPRSPRSRTSSPHPAAWATKYESAKCTARHTAAKRAVEAAYAALEEHTAKYV